jgi:hypothetical protein
MRIEPFKVFCLCLSGLILIVIACLLVPRKPAVSLTFRGFETNHFLEGASERISAVIEVSNRGPRAVSYCGYHKPENADYICLYQIAGCWTNPASGFHCGATPPPGWTWRQFVLEPSQTVVFQAVMLQRDTPCKIGMFYFPIRATNRLSRITRFLDWLPWRKDFYVASTLPFTSP